MYLVPTDAHSQASTMFLASSLAICAVVASYLAQLPAAVLYGLLSDGQLAPTSLTDFIDSESPVALQGVLQNIVPHGVDAIRAAPGVVVASPSRTNPDCK